MNVQIVPMESSTAPDPEAGFGALRTEEGNLPLDAVDVHAAITGLAARVEVTQGFRNPFRTPLEATYVFPLPDRAAVTALRLEADGRTVTAELKERGEAREEYDQAIASGRRAAIAEEDRPDVFTMRVGNILPGERVTVRLTLDQPLPYEDGAATFRFPLVVAPRYIPGTPLGGPSAGSGTAADTTAVPDASRITPPILLPGFPNPVALGVTVDLDPAGLPLGPVECSLHTVVAENGTLRLEPGERLNRDFILRLPYAPPVAEDGEDTAAEAARTGLVESLLLVPDSPGEEDGEGTFTLTLVPGRDGAARPKDVVLAIDRSGSMDGWKMVAARRAAARIIDSLQAHDRFAVFSFDHVVEHPEGLPGRLAEAGDRNRFRAVEHLAGLRARGGTEILEPLVRAVGLLSDSTRDRVIVLVTDGQVGNEDQILAALSPSALDGIRVHTVGIDRAVNAGFLGRLAAHGLGRCELVESEDRLDTAMEHIHHRIAAPVLTGITLHPSSDLQILPGTLSPARPPSLFPGVPLVISGRYRGRGGSLTLTAAPDTPAPSGRPAAWTRTLPGRVVSHPALTSIWARAHLRDLEDAYAVRPSDELEQRLVTTSLKHGVLCRFTAFVAVDSRVVASGDTPHQVTQPVEIPQGWQPQPPAEFTAAPLAVAAAMPAPAPATPRSAPKRLLRGADRAGSRAERAPAPGGAPVFGGPPSGAPLPPPAPSPAPAAGAPIPPPPPVSLLELELSRLQALTDAPDEDRLRHLSDLITRLESLSLPALTPLLEELKTSPTPLTLWPRLIEALTALTRPRKRPFWKR